MKDEIPKIYEQLQAANERIAELEEALTAMEADRDMWRERTGSLRISLKNAIGEHARTLRQIGADPQALKEYMDEMAEKDERIAMLENTIRGGNNAWMSCTGANYPKHAESIIAKLNERNTELEIVVADQQTTIRMLHSSLGEKDEGIADLEASLDQCQMDYAGQVYEIKQLEVEVTELKAKGESLCNQNGALLIKERDLVKDTAQEICDMAEHWFAHAKATGFCEIHKLIEVIKERYCV